MPCFVPAAIQPPFLVVRPGTSFWVETRPPEACVTTLQAFQEGCYESAWCYDAAGFEWPIIGATLTRPPSLLQRVLPWRRVAVTLDLGARTPVEVAVVISRIAEVLRSGNEFCDRLKAAPEEILAQMERSTSVADVIRVASAV